MVTLAPFLHVISAFPNDLFFQHEVHKFDVVRYNHDIPGCAHGDSITNGGFEVGKMENYVKQKWS